MNLNPTDLSKMTAHEVANLADLDWHAVRDEGFRRQQAAEAKLARLQKQIAKAQTEMADAAIIITQAELAAAIITTTAAFAQRNEPTE